MGVRSRSATSGAQVYTVGATPFNLTVPLAAMTGEILVRRQTVIFTRDGTTPTAVNGEIARPGEIIVLNSRDELDKFEAIVFDSSGGQDALVSVEYYTDMSGYVLRVPSPDPDPVILEQNRKMVALMEKLVGEVTELRMLVEMGTGAL